MINTQSETEFMHELNDLGVVLPRGFKLIETEYILKPFDGHHILGRIDMMFRYKGKTYVGEVKSLSKSGSFFYATKILAYLAYGKYTGEFSNDVKPAIIIPRTDMKLEYQIIANELGIAMYCFDKRYNKDKPKRYTYHLEKM